MDIPPSPLARMMEARGISQKQLSELSGIARATLIRRLRRPRTLTVDELDQLASALGCKPEDLWPNGEAA